MIRENKLIKFWLVGEIVCFTTVLYLFVVNGAMNGLMLAFLFVSPLIFFKYKYFALDEMWAYILSICIIAFPLYHINSYRITTVLYSIMFITNFIFFRRLLFKGHLLRSDYLKLIRFIAYAYLLVLLIQQISVLAHIPVFNQCWKFANPFKLNSLALEPSHIGRVLLLLSFSFIRIRSKELGRKYIISENFQYDKWLWLSVSYVMLTCGSTHCLITFLLLASFILRKNAYVVFSALLLSPIFVFAFFSIDWFSQNEAIHRLSLIIPATFTFDVQTIISTDLSAAARIVPPLQYIQNINILDPNFWTGHGIDYSSNTLVNFLLNRDDVERSNAAGGLFPVFFLDYGFLAGCSFFVFLKKMALPHLISFETLMWIICFAAVGLNTYLQWCFILIMTATRYFVSEIEGIST